MSTFSALANKIKGVLTEEGLARQCLLLTAGIRNRLLNKKLGGMVMHVNRAMPLAQRLLKAGCTIERADDFLINLIRLGNS